MVRWRHLEGAIDDVRIYSRALSAEEVAVLAGGNSAYDGLNRRIVHAERDYYYNTSWQTLEVRTNGDADPLKQYVWDLRYIDAPVLRWRDGNTDGDLDDAEDDTLYYCNDANMNVTAVVDGSDGDVVERYAYDPYGRVTVLNGEDDADGGVSEGSADADKESDWDNRIGYCGYRLDPETGANGQGIMHVRRRPYIPPLGRWGSRDPLNQDRIGGGYHDGMGLYEYVRSTPAASMDPFGLALDPATIRALNWQRVPEDKATFDAVSTALLRELLCPFADLRDGKKGARVAAAEELIDTWSTACSDTYGDGFVAANWLFHLTSVSKEEKEARDMYGREVRWGVTFYREQDGEREILSPEPTNPAQKYSSRYHEGLKSKQIEAAWMSFSGYWTWECQCDWHDTHRALLETRGYFIPPLMLVSEEKKYGSHRHVFAHQWQYDEAREELTDKLDQRIKEMKKQYGKNVQYDVGHNWRGEEGYEDLWVDETDGRGDTRGSTPDIRIPSP